MLCPKCHRDVALEAVKFCPFCGTFLESRPEERRSAIVVFADLSGFTSLSERTDPDELRLLIDSIMKRFVSIVETRGGIVDKIMGDAILFLFNTERSFGDDPVRAIETVEAIRKEMAAINKVEGTALEMHFGVSFGTVSVGTVGGSRTVMGDTVNLAQRLLSIAKTGEVVASEPFVRLLSSGWCFEKLEPVRVKGKQLPITPYRYEGRVQASEDSAPFVGRKGDVARLEKKLRELLETECGTSILIVGTAGIGKSRLVAQWGEVLDPERARKVVLRFQDVGGGFYRPFERLLRYLLSSPDAGKRKQPLSPAAVADPQFWANVSYEELRRVMVDTLRNLSKQIPLVVVAEDLHFADSSAQLLILTLISDLARDRILWIATSRRPSVGFAETLEIEPLPEHDAQLLFRSLLKSGAESSLETSLIRQAAGNPFFIRELARGVELGLPEDQLFSGNIELLLAATLDAFSTEDRELIKTASVAGSSLRVPFLSKLAGISEDALLGRVAKLGVFGLSAAQNRIWFRHDLIRASAYERLPLVKRKEVHGRAASLLEVEGAYPEEIAHHYLRSEEQAKALEYCLKAAKRLANLPGQEEVQSFVSEGLVLARKLASAEDFFQLLAIKFDLDTRGMEVSEGLEVLSKCEGEVDSVFAARAERSFHLMRGQFLYNRGRYHEALTEAERSLALPDKQLDQAASLLRARSLAQLGRRNEVVHNVMGVLRKERCQPSERATFYSLLGFVTFQDRKVEQAADFLSQALAEYRKAEDFSGVFRTLRTLGGIAQDQVELEKARRTYLEAGEIAYRIGDMNGFGEAHLNLGSVNFDLIRFDEALENYDQASSLFEMMGNRDHVHRSRVLMASAYRYLGDLKRARANIKGPLEYFQTQALGFELGLALLTMASILRDEKQSPQAFETAEKAFDLLKTYPQQAERCRLLKSEVLIDMARPDKAQEEIQRLLATPASDQTQTVRLNALRLASVLSERRNPAMHAQILAYLDQTKDHPLLRRRLPLLVEALEYKKDPGILKEAREIADQIRLAFPDELRPGFDRKAYISRLKEAGN
ncbi:MAG: adenylate/guanylate cyclase domain-containing protein [Pseudomonadota bacterium]